MNLWLRDARELSFEKAFELREKLKAVKDF